MQIDAITIEKLLSFDAFDWKNLDPHLNVIVGPNGVGKTNLFHALRLVRDVLSPEQARTNALWSTAGHRGAHVDTITITLDIQFTTDWEKRLLCVLLSSVLCNQQEIQQKIQQEIQKGATETERQRSVTQNGLKRFDAWVLDQVRPEDIDWFLRGQLVLTHAGRSRWQCQYKARPGAPNFQIDLINSSTLLGHAKHLVDQATQNWGSLFVAWYHSLPERERERLINGLTGTIPKGEFPVPKFSHLPDWVSSQQGVMFRVEDQMQIVDPTVLVTRQALTSMARLTSPELSRPITARLIFQRLLEQALVFTDNVRLPYQREFTARDLYTQPFDLSNGKELARFLSCKKNGGLQDREQYDAIGQMFSRITGRQFHVVQRPAESNGSQQEVHPDISLELVTINSWGDIPLEFSGAGIAEALFLSAVLAGSNGQVVLLDEPALNLHPTMQTTLLNELQALANQPEDEGNQFLVSTHTPTLISPDAIERVSRFTLQDGHVIRHALNARPYRENAYVNQAQRNQSDMLKLQQHLRRNLAARALLFSRAVILVEGETELGALPMWFPHLAHQDIVLYSVGGKGEFISPLKLVQHFAIPWAIIGDGEVLWDLKEQKQSTALNHIDSIFATCNQPRPSYSGNPGGNSEDFVQWSQSLEPYGVFTLARHADEGFEKAVKADLPNETWIDAEKRFGANKVLLARSIAENCSCPTRVAALIRKVLFHLQKQDASISVPDGGCP